MKLHTFIISLLLVIAFLIGGTLIVTDVRDNYNDLGANISVGKFQGVFNASEQTLGNITEMSNTQKNQIDGGEVEKVDALDTIIKSSYSAARLVITAPYLLFMIVNAVRNEIQIPDFFMIILTAAVIIFIVFALIYLFMRV